MSQIQASRLCKQCGKKTLHVRSTFSNGWGLLLSIFTAGLFLPVWFLLIVVGMLAPYRCQACGTTRM